MKSRHFAVSALVGAAVLFSPLGFASGGSGTSGGGGGGGTTTTTTTTSVLPTTAPAPGVLMRESFGFADLLRPAGGKGTLKQYVTNTAITGFWIEYPGSKDTAWLAPAETAAQTWKVCAESDNPYEMFSPIQVTWGNGCLVSNWNDAVNQHPTALMPFKAPASAYEISLNVWVSPLPTTYVGFGFTDSSVLDSNLETSSGVWIRMYSTDITSSTVNYELRTNGMSGPVLGSGSTYFDPFSRVVLSYDPTTRTVSASVNETPIGTFPIALSSPKFIGIEGVGIVDNFVVRQLP